MAITCFVTGAWFAHARKVVLPERPRSVPELLERLSESLKERIARVFYYEAAASVFVEIDEKCLSDVQDNCRLEAHRSLAAAAASRRQDSAFFSDAFDPHGGEGGKEQVVAGASKGWDQYVNVPSGCAVTINVGGKLFATRVETLTRISDSLLGGMFEGRLPVSRDAHGRIFIDRDPKIFKYVLTYLRDGSIAIPRDPCKSQAILAEARYFQLAELEDMSRNAWKEVLVLTFFSMKCDALVNTVHIDGPPQEIKRLRSLLTELLGPENFAYLLDGTVLTINVDGAHGGIEMPSHGLGGWNHGNSLFRALTESGWELWEQDLTSHSHSFNPSDVHKDGGRGSISGRGTPTASKQGSQKWGEGITDLSRIVSLTTERTVRGLSRSAVDCVVPQGCLVARYVMRR